MTNEVTTGGTDLYAQLACRIRNALGEFDDRDKDLETLIRDLARVRTRDDGLRADYEALVIRLGELTEKLEAAKRDAERYRFIRSSDADADEVGRLRAALAQSIGTVRELMAERDALRARIDGAVKVEDFRRYICGHEYLDISGTDETEVSDGNLYGKRVALVVIE